MEVGVPAEAEQLIRFARVMLIPVGDDRSADSGIPSLFVTPTVQNLSYKSPPAAPVLTQTSPAHTLTLFLFDPLKITLLQDVTSCKRYLYKHTRRHVTEESNVHSHLNVIISSALESWGSPVGVVTRMRAG